MRSTLIPADRTTPGAPPSRRWARPAGLAALSMAVIALAWFTGGQDIGIQLVAWQRDLHRALTTAIATLDAVPTATAWLSLLGLSFGYGVFHAAGPGHGKAVLSTWYGLTRQGFGCLYCMQLSSVPSDQGARGYQRRWISLVFVGWVPTCHHFVAELP